MLDIKLRRHYTWTKLFKVNELMTRAVILHPSGVCERKHLAASGHCPRTPSSKRVSNGSTVGAKPPRQRED